MCTTSTSAAKKAFKAASLNACPCTGGVKSVAQILGLIGGATLAVQTVVLGASLFQKAAKPPPDLATFGEGEVPPGSPGAPGPPLQKGEVQIITPNTPTPGLPDCGCTQRAVKKTFFLQLM